MTRLNRITALTQNMVLTMFKDGTCICSRYEDRNHIYIPLDFYDINILSCCGVITLGPTASLNHQNTCDRYISYSEGIDYVQPWISRQNVTVKVDVPVLAPITLVKYQESGDKAVVSRYKCRSCLRYHHNDLFVCECGSRSSNYWGLIKTHQKECDKGSLGQENIIVQQTVIPVAQVLDEAQQVRVEKLRVAVEEREAKRIEKARLRAVSKAKSIKKRTDKVKKRRKKTTGTGQP